MKHNLTGFKAKGQRPDNVSFGSDNTVKAYLVEQKMESLGFTYCSYKKCYVPTRAKSVN